MRKLGLKFIMALSATLCSSEFVMADVPECEPGSDSKTITMQLKPEHKSYEVVPGTYEWVDGEVGGNSLEYEIVPARFSVTSGSMTLVLDGVEQHPQKSFELISESYPIARFKTNQVKDGRTRVQVSRPKFKEKVIPAETSVTHMSSKGHCQILAALQ